MTTAESIPDVLQRVRSYMEALPAGTRSSLLIDLQAGKRIELDALAGDVVRRASALGVPTPVMATLAATLTPYRNGRDASPGRPSPARSASGPSQVDGSTR